MTQQTMTARKKRRAGKRKKKQAAARVKREIARKPSLQSDLELFHGGQDAKLRAVGRVCGTIWENQKELDQAHHKLDQQQFVLARLLIPAVNDVLLRIGSDDLLTHESMGQVFLDWDEFRARPDYKNLLLEWMMGVPLAELPPVPEVKKEAPTDPAKGDGPQEFGGDYGSEGQTSSDGDEASLEEQSEEPGEGEEDEVPEGQDADDPTPEVG